MTADTFVTDQMDEALTALQTVRPFDYAGAYYAAYCGTAWIDPRNHPTGCAMIWGRSLALKLWLNRMSATIALRDEAKAASSPYLAAS